MYGLSHYSYLILTVLFFSTAPLTVYMIFVLKFTYAGCNPNYTPCLPIVSDLDCADIRAMGLGPVTVIGKDVYRLDGDGDGKACN